MEWTRLLGSASSETFRKNEWGTAVTTDSDGSIYVAGMTVGNLDDQLIEGSDSTYL